ncbi:ABC transporter permease [Zavarzinia compransoris]|uniref:ABC transporter permease n=1 Tax=Zavarzinia compransoris TaxID=1264899 RepID=A0A317DWF1_9PROT|nr:ABC transporter permease [Zavarzinia compransoris]PWR19019.1 ABC transporter permease [Zavarzinia compransoris]TDP49025.1 NitT/TauT family transport system permease protein [Zavarzinia compransoris]
MAATTALRQSFCPVVGRGLPVAVVGLGLVVLWYAGAAWLNAPLQIDAFARAGADWTFGDLVRATWAQERPLLPAPHQVLAELWKTVAETDVTSKRSLVYHGWVTLSSTLLGFAAGTLLGILLAVGIVHVRVLEKSLMPWIIASQTIPILAIAPMIIVVLGAIGLKGLVPKAVISTYLCFFPVAIGMAKGLRAPDLLQMDLMRTYSAGRAQVFRYLRWPSALPFLFASLKVAVSISLVGAIIAELPTGAQAGLGARLLAGSYYGQTIQIWSALVAAAVLAAVLVALVGLAERLVLRAMGGRR